MSEEAITKRFGDLERYLAALQESLAHAGIELSSFAKEADLTPYHTAEARRLYGAVCGDIGATIGHMRELHDAVAKFGSQRAGK